MAYNNGFPATYQPYGGMYTNPVAYQPPMMQQPVMPQMQQAQQTQPNQTMTPPTIHAELVVVDGERAALDYPVAAGQSQMMMDKSEDTIYIKTAYANAQPTLDVFEKRPPAPPAPVFDPSAFVTRDELEERVAAILEAKSGIRRNTVTREAEE